MADTLEIIAGIAKALYILLVPGLAASFLFFKRGRVEGIARLALGFALSIAIVPMLVFYLNLAGLRLSFLMVFIIVSVSIVMILVTAWLMGNLKPGSKADYEHKIHN